MIQVSQEVPVNNYMPDQILVKQPPSAVADLETIEEEGESDRNSIEKRT